MLPETVKQMPWTDDFEVDHEACTVRLRPTQGDSSEPDAKKASHLTSAFAQVIDKAIEDKLFISVLNATHSEKFKILGAPHIEIERFAGDLFGIVARGAHLTVYTNTLEGMKIWVPRRSADSFTFPNKLDTTVAGGVPSHQSPFENVAQEADEEASLPADLIKRDVHSAGVLTYIGLSKQGFVAPDVVYVYDLEVNGDVTPTPKDGEVKEFYLMSIEEVKAALANDEFKTNSAVVMLDFFIRHGIITAEEEENFVEIVTRMHRRLPFPVTPDQYLDRKGIS